MTVRIGSTRLFMPATKSAVPQEILATSASAIAPTNG
jgi:hypothetical protein